MRILFQHLSRSILAAQPDSTRIDSHVGIVDLNRSLMDTLAQTHSRVSDLRRDTSTIHQDIESTILVTVAATAASNDSGFVTLHSMNCASGSPSVCSAEREALIRSTVGVVRSAPLSVCWRRTVLGGVGCRSALTTKAPAAEYARDIARPRPEDPPVTSATGES